MRLEFAGLAFMELIAPMRTWFDFYGQGAELFQAFRNPQRGDKRLIEENALLEKVLPGSILSIL